MGSNTVAMDNKKGLDDFSNHLILLEPMGGFEPPTY